MSYHLSKKTRCGLLRIKRLAFGRSGKGRHGAFCFANEYFVETVKAGNLTRVKVTLAHDETAPFQLAFEGEEPKEGHGTRIWAEYKCPTR